MYKLSNLLVVSNSPGILGADVTLTSPLTRSLSCTHSKAEARDVSTVVYTRETQVWLTLSQIVCNFSDTLSCNSILLKRVLLPEIEPARCCRSWWDRTRNVTELFETLNKIEGVSVGIIYSNFRQTRYVDIWIKTDVNFYFYDSFEFCGHSVATCATCCMSLRLIL